MGPITLFDKSFIIGVSANAMRHAALDHAEIPFTDLGREW